ncbi:glutathione S-transferase [Aspergillus recurvatus]
MTTIKPLTLHAHSTGPNPYKVAIVLEALKLPYTVKLWTFASDDHGVKGPRFLAINPNGRVPALEDPNTSITSWESMACINYLLRVYDNRGSSSSVLGARPEDGEKARVEIDTWVSFLVSTMGPMIGQCNWFRHYNAVRNDDACARYEAQAYRCLGVLEGQLGSHGGQWIVEGDGPSVVDYHFEPWVRQYGFAGLSLEEYPGVEGWLERVQARPEVVRAYEKVKAGDEQ